MLTVDSRFNRSLREGQHRMQDADPTVRTDLLETLRTRFRCQDFLTGQRAVIERSLAKKCVAAIFPTGVGKSLCYQLPSQLLPGVTIVVSPLLALMNNQCDSLA
jgi:ATP-dependent DNA helicase RecQ